MQPFGHNTDMGRKLRAVPFRGGRAGFPSNTIALVLHHNVARAEAYLHIKWHLDPSSHFAATRDMGRKLGSCIPLGREPGPHLTQCGKGRGQPACQVNFHLDPPNRLATIHQRHRQTYRTGQTDNANSFTNGRPSSDNSAGDEWPYISEGHHHTHAYDDDLQSTVQGC